MSIHEIQTKFIAEASAAPSLFADLAKVELYIAESYRSRAFIELLQNADDAGARRFLIRQQGDKLVVANDGRPFTDQDVVALCRSGASNKQRGSGTIGYRGIGFKSVAGIAHDIAVVSADCCFCFSKALTQKSLNIASDVPLIRVPHPLGKRKSGLEALTVPPLSDGFQTMFILSGLDERMVAEEAETFNQSAMLFLNHVSRVEIDLPSVKRLLVRTAAQTPDGLSIECIENMAGDDSSRWIVANAGDGAEKIAFALQDETIVPASPDQSVIHAFMPTTEFAGALLKMNGDFSTDPTRKAVNLDEASRRSFEQCVEAICKLLQTAVSRNRLRGIFSPFVLTSPIEGRFRKLLRESLLRVLGRSNWKIAGRNTNPIDIRLRPDWLSYADYVCLCQATPHIPQKTLSLHPQLPEFLRWLGARPFSLEEVLALMVHTELSPLGCAQVLCRAAKQYRFDLTEERLTRLANSPLLATVAGRLPPSDYKGERLLSEFEGYLIQQQESEDIRYLSRRLKLPDGLLGAPVSTAQNSPMVQPNAQSHSASADGKAGNKSSSLFKTPPAIKAWRSAEQNALAWFAALNDVIAANDVSQANVGYDIEVIKRDGQRAYVEVKSVSRFGDAFRLTNNEHATAYQLGPSYLLALVVNGSDQFHIRFVRDPVRALKLEKRCEQWSWYSDNYLDSLTDLTEAQRDSNS